ncbi:MAG TPA: tetratricopeptide repeat protein [Pyrinomonadaceae bacterium]|nr:tetratricopeptide repeat protein [Pyrinomonadaceae bacterium]
MLLALLALCAALAAGCSNPEKAKAEHVARGEALLKERRWQEATIEFRNAIQIDDSLAQAHWGLARAYEELGRAPEAFEEWQKTARLDPNNVPVRIKLAKGYIAAYGQQKNQDFLAEAERYIGEVLAREANNPDGYILQANVLFYRGDPKQAEEKINHAISLDPQRIESHMGLAQFYLMTNRTADAEAVFKKAISINDRSSLAHGQYAIFLVQTGRSAQAEAEFRRAVEVDPENRDARKVLASFYLVNNRMQEAEAAYKEWAQLDWDKPEGRARLADYYATVGRYDEAAALYREIVGSAPDFARGRYRLGEISLQRGDKEAAREQVAELLKRNERDADARLLRARMSMADGKARDAIADLKPILDLEPRSQLGLYFMAEALYRDGQLEQARARVGELERYYPDFLPARLLQIQINFDTGDAEGAKRMADELLKRVAEAELKPDANRTPQLAADVRTNALLLRGMASLRLGQTAAARADMEAARAVSPGSPMPHINLADVALAEGKYEEARQHAERALSIDRANLPAFTKLLTIAVADRRLPEVRGRLEQLAREMPQSAPVHYLLGNSYRVGYGGEGGVPADAARAEAAMRRAVEIDPDYIAAYSALGEIYFTAQPSDPDRAIAEYRKITERRDDYVDAYLKIGLIESGRKNLDAAEQYYRRVLSIRPDEPIAANNLASMYADHGRGNADEAMRLAQDIVRRYPNNPGFADTLGWVYYRKGLHRDAVEQLQRAVSISSKMRGDNSLYRWHLGAALAAKGDKAAARRELQKALELAAQEQQRGAHRPTQTPVEDVRRTLESL